jgi:hypothetical protein
MEHGVVLLFICSSLTSKFENLKEKEKIKKIANFFLFFAFFVRVLTQ